MEYHVEKDSGSSKICEYSNYLKYRYLPLKYRIGVHLALFLRDSLLPRLYLSFVYRLFAFTRLFFRRAFKESRAPPT